MRGDGVGRRLAVQVDEDARPVVGVPVKEHTGRGLAAVLRDVRIHPVFVAGQRNEIDLASQHTLHGRQAVQRGVRQPREGFDVAADRLHIGKHPSDVRIRRRACPPGHTASQAAHAAQCQDPAHDLTRALGVGLQCGEGRAYNACRHGAAHCVIRGSGNLRCTNPVGKSSPTAKCLRVASVLRDTLEGAVGAVNVSGEKLAVALRHRGVACQAARRLCAGHAQTANASLAHDGRRAAGRRADLAQQPAAVVQCRHHGTRHEDRLGDAAAAIGRAVHIDRRPGHACAQCRLLLLGQPSDVLQPC